MDINLQGDWFKLVRYAVLFVKPEYEQAFPAREEIVSDNINSLDFTAWKVEEFIQKLMRGESATPLRWLERDYPPSEFVRNGYLIGLPDEDKKHLKIYLEVLGNSFQIYGNPIFQETCSLIVVDFQRINLELIEYFATHPDELQNLEWRKFEELLEAVFRNQGFHTELGPGRNDKGVDLRLIQKDSVGEVITLVQVKRYKSDNPIGLEAVAALYATVEDQKANRGLFVTTSRYLPGAMQFAERQQRRLTLATSEEVAEWCKSISFRQRLRS